MVTRLRRARCCVLDSRPQTTATVVEIAPTYPHGAHAPKLKLQVAATTRSLTRRRRRKARAAGRRRPSLRMPLIRRRHRCLWTRTPPRRRTPPPVTSLMTPSGQGGGLVPRPPSHPALVRDVREQPRAREQAPRQEARKTLDRPIVHRMRSVNFRVGWQHFGCGVTSSSGCSPALLIGRNPALALLTVRCGLRRKRLAASPRARRPPLTI